MEKDSENSQPNPDDASVLSTSTPAETSREFQTSNREKPSSSPTTNDDQQIESDKVSEKKVGIGDNDNGKSECGTTVDHHEDDEQISPPTPVIAAEKENEANPTLIEEPKSPQQQQQTSDDNSSAGGSGDRENLPTSSDDGRIDGSGGRNQKMDEEGDDLKRATTTNSGDSVDSNSNGIQDTTNQADSPAAGDSDGRHLTKNAAEEPSGGIGSDRTQDQCSDEQNVAADESSKAHDSLPAEDVKAKTNKDDDVVVLETHDNADSETGSGANVSSMSNTIVATSSSSEAVLDKTTATNGAGKQGGTSVVSSAGTFRPPVVTTALPTSIASVVLKALATSQAAVSSSTGGTGILLSRLIAPASSTNDGRGKVGSSTTTIASTTNGSVRIVTAGLPSTNGRQLLPKPVVATASLSTSLGGQHSKTQTSRSDNITAAQANGAANGGYENRQDAPAYLKEVLSLNSVLPYRFEMLPKQYGFLTPDGGYRCETCGDAFALKTCLEFHLQRRSLVIECNCTICRQPLVFFNKCIYYAHIRQHSGVQSGELVGDIIMRNVNVKPIVWELMQLTYEDTAFKRMSNIGEFWAYETGRPLSMAMEGGHCEEIVSVAASTRFGENGGGMAAAAAGIGSGGGAPTMDRRVAQQQQQPQRRVRCVECNREFAHAAALRQHFMYNLPPNQKQLICSTCQAVYFSRCGFTAHMRTHSKTAPFACPECGTVESSAHLLNTHVFTHQRNPTVMDAWRCQKCLTFYSSWEALIIHVGAAHCESYYRCQHCPMAFTTFPAFEHHLHSQHDNIPFISAADSRLLLRCCQCDMVYVSREQLVDHLRSHFMKLMPFVVYRCAICGRLMENKSGLLGHFRNVHRFSILANEVTPVKIQVAQSGPPSAASVNKAAPPPESSIASELSMKAAASRDAPFLSCAMCPNKSFPNTASLKLHMKRRHPAEGISPAASEVTSTKKAKIAGEESSSASASTTTTTTVTAATSNQPMGTKATCRHCSRRFDDAAGLLDDGIRHLQSKINVCLLCRNNDCGTATFLQKHLQSHVEKQVIGRGRRLNQKDMIFSCEGHCEKTFSSPATALAHLRALHLLPPLRCFACNCSFFDEGDYSSHLLEHGDDHPQQQQQSSRKVDNSSAALPRSGGPSEQPPKPPPASASATATATAVVSPQSVDITKFADTTTTASTAKEPAASNSSSSVRCNKCYERFADIRAMRSHATVHKEAKYYLCLECGLSFAATASLGRHLIVAHKIVNVENYLQDFPAANPAKPSELECTVCHKEFPSKPLLDAHVRTHGLLFLKTKARLTP